MSHATRLEKRTTGSPRRIAQALGAVSDRRHRAAGSRCVCCPCPAHRHPGGDDFGPAGCSWISGVMGLVTTFWMRHAPGFWWSLISAALGVLVGVAFCWRSRQPVRCR